MGAERPLDDLVIEARWDQSWGADEYAPFSDNNFPWGRTSVELNRKSRGFVVVKLKLGGVWARQVPRSMMDEKRVASVWSNMIE